MKERALNKTITSNTCYTKLLNYACPNDYELIISAIKITIKMIMYISTNA